MNRQLWAIASALFVNALAILTLAFAVSQYTAFMKSQTPEAKAAVELEMRVESAERELRQRAP